MQEHPGDFGGEIEDKKRTNGNAKTTKKKWRGERTGNLMTRYVRGDTSIDPRCAAIINMQERRAEMRGWKSMRNQASNWHVQVA